MSIAPHVSIVIPVYNDEEWVGASIESCLRQTLENVEVICVDDASTDGTPHVIERYAKRDPRVTLIRSEINRSAFQARRAGIMAANSARVMFLDGDDELAPTAAETALEVAKRTRADAVGFGVKILAPEGVSVGRFEAQSQPVHRELLGDGITPGLFPPGKIAQGHLWRYLWDVRLLRSAYERLPKDLVLPRANDIPVSFLALALAKKYVSTSEKLYRYFWRRGVSGQKVTDVPSFEFYLDALKSIDSIADPITALGESMEDPARLNASYHSARLSIIQMILRYCVDIESTELQTACFGMLQEQAGRAEVVLATATFYRDALPFLARHAADSPALDASVATVLLTTGNLQGGGIQAVVASQAKYLVDAGYKVVVAARSLRNVVQTLPEGVELVGINGQTSGEKLQNYLDICEAHAVDVVIDHYILFYDDWPLFALAANATGIPTIGWIHNFALRPLFDLNERNSYFAQYLPILSRTVTLSAEDVKFWKLRGVNNVVYLPNPPSPLLLDLPWRAEPRTFPASKINLVWWGRLQQHTKSVRALIEVAASLRDLAVDFHLTVIGPDSPDQTAGQLHDYAKELGIDDQVSVPGPLYGEELLSVINDADLYVSTSAIEGYLLALIEAQALGLPVAMFELPWLLPVQNNHGLVTAPQGQARQLALEIAHLARHPKAYEERSRAALEAARSALSYDFSSLYSSLVTASLSTDWSPEPTIKDAGQLLSLTIGYAESINGRERRRERRSAYRTKQRVNELENNLHAERTVAKARERRLVDLSNKLEWEKRTVESLRTPETYSPSKVLTNSFQPPTGHSPKAPKSQEDLSRHLDRIESLLVVGQRDTIWAIGSAADETLRQLTKTQLQAPKRPTARDNEPAIIKSIRPTGRLILRVFPRLHPVKRRFNRWVRTL